MKNLLRQLTRKKKNYTKLKPKKKVFSKSRARKELHTLWSLAVRQRDRYACQWCAHDGKTNVNLHHHAHHIVPRSISALRYSITLSSFQFYLFAGLAVILIPGLILGAGLATFLRRRYR